MMSPLSTLCHAAFFFAAALIPHWLICRFTGSSRFMAKGLLVGFVLVSFVALNQVRAGSVNLLLIYICGASWLAYMMFFVNLMNSVTLKMLAKMSGEKVTDKKAFSDIAAGKKMFAARIEAIRKNRFVKDVADGIEPAFGAKVLLRSVSALRKIFSIDHVG